MQVTPHTRYPGAVLAVVLACAPLAAQSGPAETETARSGHWAYRRPVRPPAPQVEDADWPCNPIDAFVLARLEAAGRQPSPRAEPARLLRRVHLDLTGLPPTLEQIEAFEADPSQRAWRRVVDRLLASPRFGEHQARQWLDLARYADSNGFQADQLRDSWAFRDWVIDALNDDMPFDRFTVEQLAGDLLPDPTLEQRIATGFHRTVTCNVEAGVHPEANRVDQVVDRVNTTATVWLGTTMECAQCHDHKYDPFSQRDYYQLFAFFNNTPIEVVNPLGEKGVRYDFNGPWMDLPLRPEQQARLAELGAERARLRAEHDAAVAAARLELPRWEQELGARLAQAPDWDPLEVAEFTSTGGEQHQLLDDGSVLLAGPVPDTSTYTVQVDTGLQGITAFRLEVLTHPSLPGTGPGRGDDERPNFVLSALQVEAAPQGGSGPAQRLELHDARADHWQPNGHVRQAIDGKADTGWSIGGGFFEDHAATFAVREPIGSEAGTTLTFTLDQNHGRGRTIGRFRLSAWRGDPTLLAVPDDVAALLVAATDDEVGLDPAQREELAGHYLETRPEIARLRGGLEAVQRRIDAIEPDRTLVMVEREAPRETCVMRRGDYLQPGEAVEAGTPPVLHPFDDAWPRNRLGLAHWLVDPDNPLVARVTVNRWWSQLFGAGLVATEEDFGLRCEPPTHPGLLDWLAVEFVTSGWSRKHMLRQIVTSATYQQSSRRRTDEDPDNHLLGRGPRFRMTAEMIRDQALAVGGLLSLEMGGPPVFPPQPDGLWRQTGRNEPKYVVATDTDRFRRGIYVIWRRAAPYPSFVLFDGPDRSTCHPKRSRTNTPMQALVLMNDPAYVEAAMGLARRALRADGAAAPTLERMFRLVLARRPSGPEAGHLLEVFARERARLAADLEAVSELLDGVPALGEVDPGLDRVDLAAWFHVATILLNLDEAITKG